jgi:hypothetical protein
MATPPTRHLSTVAGDTFSHTIEIKNANGTPINVSARTYTGQVRRYTSSTSASATFTVDMTNAATGKVVISLSATTTAGLAPGPYWYNVQQTVGSTVTTLFRGDFLVIGDETRA